VMFRKRIHAYQVFFQTGEHVRQFDSRAITVAFTTFLGEARRDQMRTWTAAELDHETLRRVFRFASLTRPLETAQVWFEPMWYSPFENEAPSAQLAI